MKASTWFSALLLPFFALALGFGCMASYDEAAVRSDEAAVCTAGPGSFDCSGLTETTSVADEADVSVELDDPAPVEALRVDPECRNRCEEAYLSCLSTVCDAFDECMCNNNQKRCLLGCGVRPGPLEICPWPTC